MNIEKAEKILALQLDWVKTADSKVPPIFAINVAMLGVLAALISATESWSICLIAPAAFPAFFLGTSILILALVVFPRLKGPKGSHIFFGEIANKTKDVFVSGFQNQSDEEYMVDVLTQAHRNAEIAKEKYAHIKWAMISTFISIPFWLMAIHSLKI
jgi:hypothetical protein